MTKRQAKREVCAFIAGILANFESHGWPNEDEKSLTRIEDAADELCVEMLRRSGEEEFRTTPDGSEPVGPHA